MSRPRANVRRAMSSSPDLVVRLTIDTPLQSVGAQTLREVLRTDGAKPVLVDLAVSGVWLALAQRDEFLSVLAQNNGDIKALSTHLRAAQAR